MNLLPEFTTYMLYKFIQDIIPLSKSYLPGARLKLIPKLSQKPENI